MQVGQEQRDSLKGLLLVATPQIDEPTFRRTVILVLNHNPEGAIGVVLNRTSPVPVEAALEKWTALTAHPSVVFTGGPMETDSAIGLAKIRPDSTAEVDLFRGRIGVVDLSRDPHEISNEISSLRIFSGYAGWGAGQLEAEIYDQAWWTIELDGEDPMTHEPNSLWRRALGRQDGKIGWYANYPDDPEHN